MSNTSLNEQCGLYMECLNSLARTLRLAGLPVFSITPTPDLKIAKITYIDSSIKNVFIGDPPLFYAVKVIVKSLSEEQK